MSFFCTRHLPSAAIIACLLFVSPCVGQEGAQQPAAGQPVPGKTSGKYVEVPAGLTANMNVSAFSQYVWRGLELSKDSLVIFPSVTIGYKGFAFNLWADIDTHFNNPPPGNSGEFKMQETDMTVTYTGGISPLKTEYTFGWIYYDSDGFYGIRPTENQELFLTLAPELPLNPSFSVYGEVEAGTSWYFSLTLSHSFNVYRRWSLELSGSGGYLYNKEEAFSSLHDMNVSAGLKIPLSEHMSLTPKLQYSFPLNSTAARRIEANSFNQDHTRHLYGGIIFDYSIP
jgi:hypothetical protein